MHYYLLQHVESGDYMYVTPLHIVHRQPSLERLFGTRHFFKRPSDWSLRRLTQRTHYRLLVKDTQELTLEYITQQYPELYI